MTKNKNLLRKDIGVFLRKARKEQALTGNELGKLMHISQQQISRYERGETGINIETLGIILELLGKSWSDLFYSVMINYSDDISEVDAHERNIYL